MQPASAGLKTGVERASCLPEDLFVIPDGEHFLLYAPLLHRVIQVNPAAVVALKRFKRGHPETLRAHPRFVDQLEQAGFLLAQDDPRRRFSPSRGDRPFDPKGMTLLLTTRCSMRCIYCYAGAGDRSRQMSWPIARNAIRWMVQHTQRQHRRAFALSFHGGGEVTTARALLRRCVDEARERAQHAELRVSFQAGLNGIMDAATRTWVVDHLDGATVSLDGLPAVHNAQRPLRNGASSFPRVAETLRYFDARGFSYGLRLTVTAGSVASLAESVAFIAREFGARIIQVEPVFPAGRALQNGLGQVDAQTFVAQFQAATAIAHRYDKHLKYSGLRLDSLTQHFCSASDDALAVTPEGLLSACYEVQDQEDPRAELFLYGRIDGTSPDIVVDQDRLRRLRALSVEHKPYCQYCFCKWHCAGDCAAKLALGHPDPWDPSANPRCTINRALTLDQLRACLGNGRTMP